MAVMEYYDHKDDRLIEAAKEGDDDAFRMLMRRYMPSIAGFARQYVKTEDEADDVVQDTFFKVWKNISRFKPGAAFRPWLYTIARNTALDRIKKSRSASFSEMEFDEADQPFADTLEDAGPTPQELFERAELSAELMQAMEILHPDHRAVVIMHYREELTFDEIALIMKKPMNTVKSWHRRALIRLRSRLPHRKPL